jgi:hypothetical protein
MPYYIVLRHTPFVPGVGAPNKHFRPERGTLWTKEEAAREVLRISRSKPAEEAGAEGKPQTLLPGVAPVTDKDKADVKAKKPLKGTKPQKEPGGMFSDEADQTDIGDFLKTRNRHREVGRDQRRRGGGRRDQRLDGAVRRQGREAVVGLYVRRGDLRQGETAIQAGDHQVCGGWTRRRGDGPTAGAPHGATRHVERGDPGDAAIRCALRRGRASGGIALKS